MPVRKATGTPLLAAILAISSVAAASSSLQTDEARIPLPLLDPRLKNELGSYLRRHLTSPEEYVLSKFKDNEIVFIGEYHRIRHDVQLIQRLIPRLYEAGITNLGIEFGVYRDQERVDALVNAPAYDEQAARDIMFDFGSYWAFQDYEDIYRAAWEVNRRLPPGAPRFRVVNLNAYVDWSFVRTEADRNNPAIMKQVFPEGDSDKVMAEVIIREFVDKGQKALVYSGIHHAFTRYRQPICDKGQFVRFIDNRMGNRVYRRVGGRVCTVYLHAPWSDASHEREMYAAGGLIDAFFAGEPGLPPVGFDLAGSPFGELGGAGSLYEQGYAPFTLKLFADGYVFTMPLSQYQGVTVDEKFITKANFKRAVDQIPNPTYKTRVKSIGEMLESNKNDANMARRFRRFN